MSAITNRIAAKKLKLAELQASEAELQLQFQDLCDKHKINSNDPQTLNSAHIENLKQYNELRDTGLRLAQLIADDKRCRIKDVFAEMGFEMAD